MDEPSALLSLPDELLLMIAAQLDPLDLMALARVCLRTREIVMTPELWRPWVLLPAFFSTNVFLGLTSWVMINAEVILQLEMVIPPVPPGERTDLLMRMKRAGKKVYPSI
jgi:hypothetical protein